MSITVVGSVALDSITSRAGSVERAVGGSAIHFSNAASLCSPVNVVGVVGDDYSFSEIEFLKTRGVDFSALEVVPGGKTFFWKGRYEEDVNHAISEITELNVFETFAPELNSKALSADIFFLANIHPSLQKHVLGKIKQRRLVVLDSMNFWIDQAREELEEVIGLVDGVILNEEEVRSLTGCQSLLSAGRVLLDCGPRYVIIKKGEHGVLAISKDWVVAFPAVPLSIVVDPTGAGDSFAGALLSYLDRAGSLEREVWKEALVYANCVASFNVQGFSVAGIKAVTREQIAERFQDYKKIFSIRDEIDVTDYVTVKDTPCGGD